MRFLGWDMAWGLVFVSHKEAVCASLLIMIGMALSGESHISSRVKFSETIDLAEKRAPDSWTL